MEHVQTPRRNTTQQLRSATLPARPRKRPGSRCLLLPGLAKHIPCFPKSGSLAYAGLRNQPQPRSSSSKESWIKQLSYSSNRLFLSKCKLCYGLKMTKERRKMTHKDPNVWTCFTFTVASISQPSMQPVLCQVRHQVSVLQDWPRLCKAHVIWPAPRPSCPSKSTKNGVDAKCATKCMNTHSWFNHCRKHQTSRATDSNFHMHAFRNQLSCSQSFLQRCHFGQMISSGRWGFCMATVWKRIPAYQQQRNGKQPLSFLLAAVSRQPWSQQPAMNLLRKFHKASKVKCWKFRSLAANVDCWFNPLSVPKWRCWICSNHVGKWALRQS